MEVINTMKWLALLAAMLLAPSMAMGAETIVLKDGRFIVGDVVRETSKRIRVATEFGVLWYDLEDVEQRIASMESDDDAVSRFHELPDVFKAVLNAEAEYRLGEYDKAKKRIEPHLEYDEQPGLRSRIDWLWIELLEREAAWEEVTKLLKAKKKDGGPREKERAEAHLDILEANSGEGIDVEYSLQWAVEGGHHARVFLKDDELKARARDANALADVELMQAALEEYCKQFLIYNRENVRNLEDELGEGMPDIMKTFEAVRNSKDRDLVRDMPYYEHMMKAEDAVLRAEAIMGPAFSSGYAKDIVSYEAEHLFFVLHYLLTNLINQSPENMIPAIDPRTNRLTPPGRAQWRQQCDQFLEAAKPIARLSRYMQDRADRYPRHMAWLRKVFSTHMSRFDQMVTAVKRARSITQF